MRVGILPSARSSAIAEVAPLIARPVSLRMDGSIHMRLTLLDC